MLEGKTLIVTGAGGALGRAVCARAESLGAATVRLDLAFAEKTGTCHEVDLMDTDQATHSFASVGTRRRRNRCGQRSEAARYLRRRKD